MADRGPFPKYVEADEGLHWDPSSNAWWDWWYFDADFDNGYKLVTTYHFGSPHTPEPQARFIEFVIYDPEWNRHFIRKRYPLEECACAEGTCDVIMAHNTIKGEGVKKWTVKFSEGGLACDCVWESLVEGYVMWDHSRGAPRRPELPRTPGSAPRAAARAKVTGTITVDGKTMEVSGLGYHDKTGGNVGAGAGGTIGIRAYWIWGRVFFGRYTLVFTSMGGSTSDGTPQTTGFVCIHRDEKLEGTTTEIIATNSDFTLGDLSTKHPQLVTYEYKDPGFITGKMSFRLIKVIEFMDLLARMKPMQKWFTKQFVVQPAYLRYCSQCEADLEILGEKVTYSGPVWFEHMKLA